MMGNGRTPRNTRAMSAPRLTRRFAIIDARLFLPIMVSLPSSPRIVQAGPSHVRATSVPDTMALKRLGCLPRRPVAGTTPDHGPTKVGRRALADHRIRNSWRGSGKADHMAEAQMAEAHASSGGP